jgi:tetraacyldisaccharide-1-P 4'-kinase
VRPDDDVRVVGDEALVCARALDGIATVVVAPDRQHALDLAASLANVLVVDGVLQLHPRRAALSVLTVPPTSPPPRTLARVADVVVQVATTMRSPVPWEVLRKERVGLITSLARPERVLRALAMHHVVPVVHIALPNHGRHAPGQTRPTPGVHVDRWLATDKCAHHLAHLAPRDHTSERTTLSCEADLSEGLEARVAAALRLDPVERAPYSQSTPVFPVVSA